MKKIILLLSLAVFLVAGFTTVTKIQAGNATNYELNFVDNSENVSIFAVPDLQDDGKKKKSKDAKTSTTKAGKDKCDKSKCPDKSKKCCSKAKKCQGKDKTSTKDKDDK